MEYAFNVRIPRPGLRGVSTTRTLDRFAASAAFWEVELELGEELITGVCKQSVARDKGRTEDISVAIWIY